MKLWESLIEPTAVVQNRAVFNPPLLKEPVQIRPATETPRAPVRQDQADLATHLMIVVLLLIWAIEALSDHRVALATWYKKRYLWTLRVSKAVEHRVRTLSNSNLRLITPKVYTPWSRTLTNLTKWIINRLLHLVWAIHLKLLLINSKEWNRVPGQAVMIYPQVYQTANLVVIY